MKKEIESDPEPNSLAGVVRQLRALADPVRLRILGLTAERERSGQELAELVELSPPTVSHHLRLLREAGLLRETRHAPYTYYTYDAGHAIRALKALSERKKLQEFAREDDTPGDERRVLNAFFDGPRLKAIPAQRRKKQVVFEELLRRLPRRREFTEKELSLWIERRHSDFCTIRREFIIGGYMDRADGIYRLTQKGREIAYGRRTPGAPEE